MGSSHMHQIQNFCPINNWPINDKRNGDLDKVKHMKKCSQVDIYFLSKFDYASSFKHRAIL